MIVEIIQIILGTLFALFIPGYLIVKIFFDELKYLEKIVFSITFSIIISTMISIFLGYNKAWAQKTGGLTLINIIYAQSLLFLTLLIILIIKNILKNKKNKSTIKKKSLKKRN